MAKFIYVSFQGQFIENFHPQYQHEYGLIFWFLSIVLTEALFFVLNPSDANCLLFVYCASSLYEHWKSLSHWTVVRTSHGNSTYSHFYFLSWLFLLQCHPCVLVVDMFLTFSFCFKLLFANWTCNSCCFFVMDVCESFWDIVRCCFEFTDRTG